MNESQAMKQRNKHIAKIKADIIRLTNAVIEFEQYTAQETDWNWVGDWDSLSNDVRDAAETAEKLSDSTYSREA